MYVEGNELFLSWRGIPESRSSFHLYGLTLIFVIIYYNVWDEITYPFLNFNDATVQVKEWIGNFIPLFTVYVVTYPCWDLS